MGGSSRGGGRSAGSAGGSAGTPMLESGRDAVSPAAARIGPREPAIDDEQPGSAARRLGSAAGLDTPAWVERRHPAGRPRPQPASPCQPPPRRAKPSGTHRLFSVGIPVLVYGVMATVSVIAFLGVVGLFLSYSAGLPDPKRLTTIQPAQESIIYDRNMVELARFSAERAPGGRRRSRTSRPSSSTPPRPSRTRPSGPTPASTRWASSPPPSTPSGAGHAVPRPSPSSWSASGCWTPTSWPRPAACRSARSRSSSSRSG